MRKNFFAFFLSAIFFIVIGQVSVLWAKRNYTTYIESYLRSLPLEPLSLEEKKELFKMRQEEKLAHDVYWELGKLYKLPIFRNIARSETRHMEMVKILLQKYGLEDPIKGMENKPGVFKAAVFKSLYKKLIRRGKRSLIEALKVGAIVEELDIRDLKKALKTTDNKDIKVLYNNLLKGSRNHLRAFVGILRRYGVNYKPRYLSPQEFNKIITTPHETGIYN